MRSIDLTFTSRRRTLQKTLENSADVPGFVHTFQEKTRLISLLEVISHVSYENKHDIVIFVSLCKLDKVNLTFPFDATPYKLIADSPKKTMAT